MTNSLSMEMKPTFGSTTRLLGTTGYCQSSSFSEQSRFVCSRCGPRPSGMILPVLRSLIKLMTVFCSYRSRKGVYYLSLAAAGFLIFILGLVVLRIVVFSFVWLITFGRHHLWLLPNLTEDVGFFASFWPLFQVSVIVPFLFFT